MTDQPLDQLDTATRRRIERDFDDLRVEFVGLLGGETVEHCLHDSLDRLADQLLRHRRSRDRDDAAVPACRFRS